MLRQSGAVLLFLAILSLSGCVISPNLSSGSSSTSSGGSTTGVGHLYVSDQSGNEILTFANATGENGAVTAATAVITGLSNPQYIFSDGANDRLYVANQGAGNILVFDSVSTLTGTASVTPTRTITSTSFTTPVDVAVDTARDILYVADSATNSIVNFAGADGVSTGANAAAIIGVGFSPSAILVDSVSNTLFVANSSGNEIFVLQDASTLNGPVTSTFVLSGSGTSLDGPSGLQMDGAGRLIVSNAGNQSITIYANATQLNGSIAPVTIISGSQTTFSTPAQVAIAPTTNQGEIYVADSNAGEIAVFDNITTATGTINASPNRNITGIQTPRGVAIDTTH